MPPIFIAEKYGWWTGAIYSRDLTLSYLYPDFRLATTSRDDLHHDDSSKIS